MTDEKKKIINSKSEKHFQETATAKEWKEALNILANEPAIDAPEISNGALRRENIYVEKEYFETVVSIKEKGEYPSPYVTLQGEPGCGVKSTESPSNPLGSTKSIGLLVTYANMFKLCGSPIEADAIPIGSTCVNLDCPGLYVRLTA
jgi:hypothetical protein